ncbi:MAG: peptidoglycan-binding protein [Clostridia bacterium]|nr:peptidoglycan-binding protein [Clostridia bacterium]
MLCFTFCNCAYAHIPCECYHSPEECTCFIQLGDQGKAVEGIIHELQKQGYLGKLRKKAEFTAEVRQAVVQFQEEHDLECNGYMDDETLSVLLTGSMSEIESAYGFVPTDGGRKYHSNPYCCSMDYPRRISCVNARILGIVPCLKCSRDGYKPYSETDEIHYIARTRDLADDYNTIENVKSDSISSEDNTVEQNSIYIGNQNSHVFHFNFCSAVDHMSEKNLVVFHSREEAMEEGYTPCSRCQP